MPKISEIISSMRANKQSELSPLEQEVGNGIADAREQLITKGWFNQEPKTNPTGGPSSTTDIGETEAVESDESLCAGVWANNRFETPEVYGVQSVDPGTDVSPSDTPSVDQDGPEPDIEPEP